MSAAVSDAVLPRQPSFFTRLLGAPGAVIGTVVIVVVLGLAAFAP